jgi:hypothetical protein
MASVVIKADRSVENVSHCIFCNEQATQSTPLTLRYFAKDSFIANLLSPLIHRRHLIYILFAGCFLGVFAAVIYSLLLLRSQFGDSPYEQLVPLLPFLASIAYYAIPKPVSKIFRSIPWRVLRTGKTVIQSPVCSNHFLALDLTPPKGPKLTAMHVLLTGASLIGIYCAGAFFNPKDWLDQFAFLGVVVMGFFFVGIIWMVARHQSRSSQRYLTGFASHDRNELKLLHCSEAFAAQAATVSTDLKTE